MDRADKADKDEQYGLAFNLYDSLIKIDSAKGKYYFRRGVCNSTFIIEPTFKDLQGLKAFHQAEKDSYYRTIKDYLKAASLNYDKPKSYLNAGVTYMFIDDNIALAYFEKSLKENPQYEKAMEEIELCRQRIKTNKHFYSQSSSLY